MKQVLISLLLSACSVTVMAGQGADSKSAVNESVYSWGYWDDSVKPAAGPALVINPSPVQTPDFKPRANENSEIARFAQVNPTSIQLGNLPVNPPVTVPTPVAAPQLPGIGVAPPGTPSGNSPGLETGGPLTLGTL